jgi:protein-S-isoprenylcysteine O-methyltransferase Ste14
MSQASILTEQKPWTTHDQLVRAVVVSLFFILETLLVFRITLMIRDIQPDAVSLARLLAQGSLMLFVALMAWLTMVRGLPEMKAPGWQPRVAALLGTNLIMVGVFFIPEGPVLGVFGSLASAALLLIGQVLAVIVIRHLGRSFSIMAEARTLVTNGPYAMVRHPLYLVEEIALLGVFIQVASWTAAALFIVQFAFQVLRMRNEEDVLRRAFPLEYAAYAARTARLIPGVW